MTLEAANASALMETVESYYAENIIAPLKLASYDELTRDHDVLDVSKLPIEFHSRFHPNLRLLWIEGRQWNGNQTRWTPYQLVHSSYTTD